MTKAKIPSLLGCAVGAVGAGVVMWGHQPSPVSKIAAAIALIGLSGMVASIAFSKSRKS